jgi:hypothetical protein
LFGHPRRHSCDRDHGRRVTRLGNSRQAGLLGLPGADTFGVDPIFNIVKTCYSWQGSPSGYGTTCATENGTCSFGGQQTVAYGADGDYVYRTFAGGAPCTNTAFGTDPIPNVPKSCYLTS